MTRKERILSIIMTIFLSVFALIPLYDFKINKTKSVDEFYRVYLNGEDIIFLLIS